LITPSTNCGVRGITVIVVIRLIFLDLSDLDAVFFAAEREGHKL